MIILRNKNKHWGRHTKTIRSWATVLFVCITLCVSLFGFTFLNTAQAQDNGPIIQWTPPAGPSGNFVPPQPTGGTPNTLPGNTNVPTVNTTVVSSSEDGECGPLNLGACFKQYVGDPLASVWEKTTESFVKGFFVFLNALILIGFLIPLMIVAALSWLAGIILNFSIFHGIEQMGTIISNVSAIRTGWGIFRDFVNLFFIFGLLYLAISTIVGGWSDNSRKSLANIIVAALLINFSYFFTAILIDASNVLTLSFYNKMTDCKPEGTISPDGVVNEKAEFQVFENGGLSNCFMRRLGLQGLYSSIMANATSDFEGLVDTLKSTSPAKLVVGLSLGTIFVVIAAAVFFAGAITIFARFIVLVFLLVTSPVMFLGFILPKLQKVSDYWKSKLTEALLSMPVLFLFLYITYLMMLDTDALIQNNKNITCVYGTGLFKDNGTLSMLVSGDVSSVGVFVSFILLIGFIIASLVMSKKVGLAGADFAMNAGGKLGFGSMGALGRNTFGRLGKRWMNDEGLQERARRGGIKGAIARTSLQASKKMATSSFDARNSGAAAALKEHGKVDFGKGQKGGYEQTLKDFDKKQKENDELYGSTDKAMQSRVRQKLESDADYGHEKWLFDKARVEGNKTEMALRQERMEAREKAELSKMMSGGGGTGFRASIRGSIGMSQKERQKRIEKRLKAMYKTEEEKREDRVAEKTAEELAKRTKKEEDKD